MKTKIITVLQNIFYYFFHKQVYKEYTKSEHIKFTRAMFPVKKYSGNSYQRRKQKRKETFKLKTV